MSRPRIFWPSLGYLGPAAVSGISQAWHILDDGSHNGADMGFSLITFTFPLLFLTFPAIALLFWLYFGKRASIITAMILAPFGGIMAVGFLDSLPGPNDSLLWGSVLFAVLLALIAFVEMLGRQDLRRLSGVRA